MEYATNLLNPVDCFHPTRCVHAALAISLRNNLFGAKDLEGWGEKSFTRILNVPGRNGLALGAVETFCPLDGDYFV